MRLLFWVFLPLSAPAWASNSWFPLCDSYVGESGSGLAPSVPDSPYSSVAEAELRSWVRALGPSLRALWNASTSLCPTTWQTGKVAGEGLWCWALYMDGEWTGQHWASGVACPRLLEVWAERSDRPSLLLGRALRNCSAKYGRRCQLVGKEEFHSDVRSSVVLLPGRTFDVVGELRVLRAFRSICYSSPFSRHCTTLACRRYFAGFPHEHNSVIVCIVCLSLLSFLALFLTDHIGMAILLDRVGDRLPLMVLRMERELSDVRLILGPNKALFRTLLHWSERDANFTAFMIAVGTKRNALPDIICRSFIEAQSEIERFPPLLRSDLCFFNFWDWRTNIPQPDQADRYKFVDLKIWIPYSKLAASGMARFHERGTRDSDSGTYDTFYAVDDIKNDSASQASLRRLSHSSGFLSSSDPILKRLFLGDGHGSHSDTVVDFPRAPSSAAVRVRGDLPPTTTTTNTTSKNTESGEVLTNTASPQPADVPKPTPSTISAFQLKPTAQPLP